MADFSFLHTADTHINSPLQSLERYEGAPVEVAKGACKAAFERLIALAIESRVAFILIAGDLWDGDWKGYEVGLYFVKQMQRLEREGIRVFIIMGNHDAQGKISKKLSIPSNAAFFSSFSPQTKLIEELHVAIHGQSFPKMSVEENIAVKYPEAMDGYFNIGLLHTAIGGRAGHDSYAPCSLNDLLGKNYQYWALGHVHAREMVNQNPPVVFPGCLQGRHINESGEKGCTLVKVVDGEISGLDHVPLDVMRWAWCKVELSDAEKPEDVIDAVGRSLDEVMSQSGDLPVAVRLELVGQTKVHELLVKDREHWINEVRGIMLARYFEEAWLEKLIVKTDFVTPPETYFVGNEAIESILKQIYEIKEDKESLENMAEVLGPMMSKLKSQLNATHWKSLNLEEPEVLSGLVDDAQDLLVAKLVEEGQE